MKATRMSRSSTKDESASKASLTKEKAHRMPREAGKLSLTSGKEGETVTLTKTNYRLKNGKGRPDTDYLMSAYRLL